MGSWHRAFGVLWHFMQSANDSHLLFIPEFSHNEIDIQELLILCNI